MPLSPLFLVGVAVVTAAASTQPKDRLHSEEARASSYLKNNWNRFSENYHPSYALDDNPKTAWVEGVDGNGEGQSLTFAISPLTKVSAVRLRVRNGYQKSKKLFRANAAIDRLRIDLLGRSGRVVHTAEEKLKRKWGWQEVAMTLAEKPGFSQVRLTIVSTYGGSVYKDTCLSDLQLFVTAGVDYNATVEKKKAAALSAWIKGRQADAKYFANLPKTYPFASTHFSYSEKTARTEWQAQSVTGDDAPLRGSEGRGEPVHRMVAIGKLDAAGGKRMTAAELKVLTTFRREIDAATKGLTREPYRLAFNDRVAPPDGLDIDWMDRFWGLLERERFTLFESSKREKHRKLGDDDYVYGEKTKSTALVRWRNAKERIPESIFLYRRERVEERTIYELDTYFLFVFDETGNLQGALHHNFANEDSFDGTLTFQYEMLSFDRDDKGRVTSIQEMVAGYDDSPDWNDEDEDFHYDATNFVERGSYSGNAAVAAAP